MRRLVEVQSGSGESRIRTGVEVRSVTRSGKKVILGMKNASADLREKSLSEAAYDQVILTCPAPVINTLKLKEFPPKET